MAGSIRDVPGIKVGHTTDVKNRTGCTVILCEEGAVAGMDIRGFAPGTRQTNSLNLLHPINRIDAICISGGGALGLDAASGVVRYLLERKKGFDIFGKKVPIVPSAVIFDLFFAEEGVYPDSEYGYNACLNTEATEREGSIGAGTGATVGKLFGVTNAMKGGIGTVSIRIENVVVGVLSVVNSFGDVIDHDGKILAGARVSRKAKKFCNIQKMMERGMDRNITGTNTTISVVATNAYLTKEDATRIAIMAQDGLARTIAPSHTLFDGDVIFVLSTGKETSSLNVIGAVVQRILAESIRRAVKMADGFGIIPAYRDLKKGNHV